MASTYTAPVINGETYLVRSIEIKPSEHWVEIWYANCNWQLIGRFFEKPEPADVALCVQDAVRDPEQFMGHVAPITPEQMQLELERNTARLDPESLIV